MTRTIHITEEPVILSGFNAILKPSKFGYSLKAVVGEDIVNKLEEERKDCLDWAQGKLSCKPNRATLKPTPWEEVYPGKFIVKFSWKEENKPPVVDTEGTLITNEDLPVYEGSQVKIGFTQKPYILRDGTTYGTSLKLSGVQIVKVILPNGRILECKGYWDSADRRKIRAVIKDNPDIDLRMVFQDPYKKISKKSKTTYATWCDRYDIKWCAYHTIPIDWLI